MDPCVTRCFFALLLKYTMKRMAIFTSQGREGERYVLVQKDRVELTITTHTAEKVLKRGSCELAPRHTWEDFDNFAKDVSSSVAFSELTMHQNIHDDKETGSRNGKENAFKDVVPVRVVVL